MGLGEGPRLAYARGGRGFAQTGERPPLAEVCSGGAVHRWLSALQYLNNGAKKAFDAMEKDIIFFKEIPVCAKLYRLFNFRYRVAVAEHNDGDVGGGVVAFEPR